MECFFRILNLRESSSSTLDIRSNGSYRRELLEVYKGLGVSISPATPLPLGKVPIHTITNSCLEENTKLRLVTYSLLAWLSHTSIGFEKRSDVLRLAAPDITVNGPIESELEASPIERTGAVYQSERRGRNAAPQRT